MPTTLILDGYARPLVRDDPRAERAVLAIEEAWSVRLVVEINRRHERVVHDDDRAAYVSSEPGFAFIATPDDEQDATLGGLVEPGPLAPGGVDELHVLGHLPAIAASHAAHGLERFATALETSWAMLTPEPAHGVIVEQVIDRENSDDQPPLGLPRLDLAEHLALHQPRRLGWINYWSDAAAGLLGFTGASDNFARVQRVGSGWIVQLTEEPLDLDRADHLAALRRAYAEYAVGRAT